MHLGVAGWDVIQLEFDPPHLCASFDLCRRGQNVQTDRPVSVEGKSRMRRASVFNNQQSNAPPTVRPKGQVAVAKNSSRHQI